MATTWSAAAAEELRAEMGRRQASNAQLAAASEMSASSVSRKVGGERVITLDEFAAMSLALDVEPDEMFNRAARIVRAA